MNIDRLQELAEAWRTEAVVLRKRGAAAQAETLESCVADHEQALQEWLNEELTLQQASEESGYSYSTLQQMHSKGTLTSVGEHGRPRIRRRDLPYKPSRSGPRLVDGQPDIAQEILSSKLADA